MLPGKKLTPADILQMVRRRFWLIAIPPAVTLFAALLVASRVPNLYQSDMLIAIDPQRVPDSFVRSTVTLRTDLRMSAIYVQVTSRTNLERMIEEHGLYAEQRLKLPMEDIVGQMRRAIDVKLDRPPADAPPGQGPSAFHVLFTYPDPNVAAQVTQELGSLFVDQNARDRSALAQATNSFLEIQLAEARARLELQECRLETFRQEHGKELPTQMQANLQTLQSLQLQVQATVESIARDRDRKLLLDRMYRNAMDEPPPALAAPVQSAPGASPPLVSLSAKQQLAAARASLASLELRFRPEHPDIVRMRRLISELEPKAAAEEQVEASTDAPVEVIPGDPVRRDRLIQMRAEIESLERQIGFKEASEARLRNDIAEYQRRIEAVPGLESEWSALTRDYDTQQTAYKDLLNKSVSAKVSVDLEQQQIGEHFRIVDPAGIPVHPLPSMRPQINFVGLALGLVLGLGVAALLGLRDSSFRTDADVLEVLALPVLACVPRIETLAERSRRLRRMALLSAAGVMCLAGAGYVSWTLKLWKSLY